MAINYTSMIRDPIADCRLVTHFAAMPVSCNVPASTWQIENKRCHMMKKPVLLFCLLVAVSASHAQNNRQTLEVPVPDNKELVSQARTVYVESQTFYMKRENLVSSLLGRSEFKAWDLRITGRREFSDLIVAVKRVPFTNHFTYTVTDRRSDTIVMAGKVDSLAGTVYGLIADEIVHKMKVLRGDPLAAPKPAQKEEAEKQ
jgi:hypothetical protein